jgi:predicted signal transduction protein with EAL and GGDEF domain
MDDIVRILFIENTEADVELARRELDRDGLRFTWRRVTTESGLWRALREFRLPVDRLKVDKSLVHSMITVPRDAAIVRTVISLGRELGFTVIAEGVETAAQFEMLRDLGCQQVQGYLTARPASATEARALLKRNWGRRFDTGRRRSRETAGIRHVQ